MHFLKLHIFIQPSHTIRIRNKRRLTGLNSEFSFSKIGCYTKVKDPCLPHHWPIAVERILEFILLPSVFVLWEIQTTFTKTCTWVTVFISNDDDSYSTGACLRSKSKEFWPKFELSLMRSFKTAKEDNIKWIIYKTATPCPPLLSLFQFKMGVVQFKMGIFQFKMEKLYINL